MPEASFGENGICAVCRRNPVTRWCDFIIAYNNEFIWVKGSYKAFKEANSGDKYETCDLPMCEKCANKVSRDRHLCPHHMKLHNQRELPDAYQKKRQHEEKRKINTEIWEQSRR
ncbi:hypothetical protein [Paenibacillus ginsengarvi]|uniref:C2H2-type domain-containing protein n=1 Tax=Paenibacillus ginsengarvi TaxID=400777 RepID=A0A3B0CV76_9BACL|nr:hypothetical protein [Paenibacillus ginsengarvi]RKN86759.1 hypothetical protein D7M11_02030 [Paenibacillus ginsengarvi]